MSVPARPGNNEDIGRCVELWTKIIVRRDGPSGGASVAESAYDAFGRSRLRFAVIGSVPIAFALTVIKEPEVALLSRLCVDPSTTSRGLGAALLADAVEHAAKACFARIELQVRETNLRAIRLYARAGFAPVSGPWVYDSGDRVVSWALDLTTHLNTSPRTRTVVQENGCDSSEREVRARSAGTVLPLLEVAHHEDEPNGIEQT